MGPKTYEVVISGMAGIFPGCDNVEELETNLMKKENLIGDNLEKWETGALGVPNYVGKFKNNLTFDNKHFGIPNSLYEIMDPLTTQSVKYSYEAICDAGINPAALYGTNTAVIMTSSISETEYEVLNTKIGGSYMVAQSRNMQANRISYFLHLIGPSLVMNSNWTGGMQALQEGYQLVSSGHASAALIGAANIIFGPEISFHFKTMGRLNEDGQTKSFSADADGYTRSEACVVFFLQRAEDAKRSYGSIVNILTCNYGVRVTAFPDFCPEQFKELLLRVYKEAQVDSSEVCYIEAEGCGIKQMDALELNCISEVMCANRTTPLAVGSVKSNVGHTEAASSLMSIVKVLMAFKSGFIAPNLHYTAPNPDVPALLSGQMEVITEPTTFNGNIIGVSSIGISGTYSHAIIKSPKINTNLRPLSLNNIPWLFIISGREELQLDLVVKKVEATPFKENFLALTHNVFQSHIKGHLFRAYSILNAGEYRFHETKPYDGAEKRPVWFLFSGMGSQWVRMGADLMRLPTFARAINYCHEVLLPKGINLLDLIYSTDAHTYDTILHSFIGIAAIQIGLVDVLRELGIQPDGIIGHSVGELGCAYADGCFTAKEMILSAYSRGKASVEAQLVKGMMAAVGLGYNQIKDQLPHTIEVACHNSNTSCTLSGPAEDMHQYVASLKEKGIFAKLVNVSNIAYHSRYIKPAAPALLKYLQEVIQKPKERTKRWLSSSIPKSSWDSDLAKFSSAEYHTNNLLNSVLFEEATAHIPERAIVIEIAPHGLLQSIIKKSLNKCTNIALVNKFEKDTLTHLFKAIGKLYMEGISIKIDNLYPKVEFPVSGNIPYIAPMLTWDGTESFKKKESYSKNPGWEYYKLSEEHLVKYLGYKIFGKQVLPSVSLLMPIMDIFKKIKGPSQKNQIQNPILMENIHFNQILEISKYKNSELCFHVQRGLGEFEVNFKSRILASGRISSLDLTNADFVSVGNTIEKPTIVLHHDDIYKYFEEFSIEFNDNFKLIQNISFYDSDLNATVQWKGQWVEFLDALLMVVSLFNIIKFNEFKIGHYIRQVYIDKAQFESYNFKELEVFYNSNTKILSCDGLKMHLPLLKYCDVTHSVPNLIKEACQFLPYYYPCAEKPQGQFSDCLQIVFQNIQGFKDNAKRLTVALHGEDGDFKNILSTYSNSNKTDIDIITSPTEETMDELYLNLKKWDHLLIIGEIPVYESVLNCLKKVKAGFVLLKDHINNNGKFKGVHPIFKLTFNDNLYTLYKMVCEENSESNIITINTSNNWKANLTLYLRNQISKTKVSSVQYIVGKIKTLSNVYNVARFCQKFGSTEMIRFFFMDDESPSFSLDLPFYQQQMALDLIMNICMKGRWGCLNLFTPTTKSLPNPSVYKQKLIYPLSAVKCKNVKLAALGMNLLETAEKHQRQQLGVFDYCGMDETGNVVCGVGALSDNTKLIEDKILRWQKPQYWSYEEAVSVPLCYSIAYYIFEENWVWGLSKRTILVHGGGSLVSQAIIHVAFSRGFEVFTTYTNVKEKELIHHLFPQIGQENIFSMKYGMFESSLLSRMKDGVDIIVNNFEDHLILKSSLQCVSPRGYFYLLNDAAKNDCTIGMKIFTKQVKVHGITAEILLELPLLVKEYIQQEVEFGMKQGHVKPLRTLTLPSDTLNINVVEMLNTKTVNSTKVVFNMDCNKPGIIDKDLFICSVQKSYIIISNEYVFWLDLVSWLLTRGAMNIHVFRDLQNKAQITAQMLASISNTYPSAKINLHPVPITASECEMKKHLLLINCNAEISELFILGKVMEEDVNKTESILRQLNQNTTLICIGNGGEAVCELRNKTNIPGLAISCELHLMRASIILPELDHFIRNSSYDNVIFLKEDIISSKTGTCGHINYFQQRIPADITELLELSRRSVAKACFVEIMTSCTSSKYNRELSPIFLIPSLKPNEMKNFTTRLHYPTFEARLPLVVDNIDTIAKDLFDDMKRFKFNVFTIIANESGGAVGLNLAKYLENNGKLVLLILLNSSPDFTRNWAATALQMGEVNLINKYVKVPYKVQMELLKVSNWQQKLAVALQNSNKEENEREELRKALNLLRDSLLSLMKYTPVDEMFQGKCFIYRPRIQEEDSFNVAKYCKRKPIIKVRDAGNHQEMLDDHEIVKEINSLIPYEYKSAAQVLDCEQLGQFECKSLRNWLFEDS